MAPRPSAQGVPGNRPLLASRNLTQFLSRSQAELYIREGNSRAGRHQALVRMGGLEGRAQAWGGDRARAVAPSSPGLPCPGLEAQSGRPVSSSHAGALPLSPQGLVLAQSPPPTPMARAFRSCLTVSTLGSWRGALLTLASKPRPGPLGWASQPAVASLAGADWVFLDGAHWTHNVTSEVLGCPQTGSHLAVSSVMGHAGWIPLGSLSPSFLTPLVSPEWPGLRGWLRPGYGFLKWVPEGEQQTELRAGSLAL